MKRNCPEIIVFTLFLLFFALFCSAGSIAAEPVTVTVHYSNVTDELQTISVEFFDEWLLQPDDAYNHKLMQASFVMALAGFRSKLYDLSEKDHDILDFFAQAGFTAPRSDDFSSVPGADTIGTAIAHKKTGEDTIIAVSVSGNNYENEWLSNLTVDDENRPAGFNSAAGKVMQRVKNYIDEHQLTGSIRLWVSGYSRAAAVSNIFAADAVESHLFSGVYAYTFATPRTTREADPGRYSNIFNIINPEDVVPMIPFPEWGYERYGIDLFIPSISTDSEYNSKYVEALELADFNTTDLPVFNPQMRRDLRTFLDYIAYFINSASSYEKDAQQILLNLWRNRDFGALLKDIREKISFRDFLRAIPQINVGIGNRISEFYYFIDFVIQVTYSTFIQSKFNPEDAYWDSTLSLQENIAYGHYDKTYRFWVFSSEDPERVFTKDPKYFHYTILGDVDVEIYDERGDLVEMFDREGYFDFDMANIRNPDFHGGMSETIVFVDRQGNQTMIELPADQAFTIYIHSNKDQRLRISNVEFFSNKLQAKVRYIYYDSYKKDEGYAEYLSPEAERATTDEMLMEYDGVQPAAAWGEGVDYSPTAVMRLEYAGIFITKPLALMILIQILINVILIVLLLVIVKIIHRIVLFTRRKRRGNDVSEETDRLEKPGGKTRPLPDASDRDKG